VARLLIAQGDVRSALRALDHWRATAHAEQRALSEIEIDILTALAHFASGDRSSAARALDQALAQARPAGFQRIFLDEGEPMAALLAQSVEHRAQNEPIRVYAERLLSVFPETHVPERRAQNNDTPAVRSTLERSSGLVEPLSPQEQRVLRLLAAGLSN